MSLFFSSSSSSSSSSSYKYIYIYIYIYIKKNIKREKKGVIRVQESEVKYWKEERRLESCELEEDDKWKSWEIWI